MTRDRRSPFPQRLQALRERVLRRIGGRHGGDEGGFILLESLIAISLITVIMAAVGVEFLTGMVSSAHQRAEKKAIELASTSMERVRALHPSDIYAGRTQNNAESEHDTLAGISAVTQWIGARTQAAYGPASATNPVPTTPDTTTSPYSVYQYLECTGTRGSDGSCNTGSSSTANYVRVIIAVTWKQRGCANLTCAYVMSSLLNTDQNPQFDDNQPLPAAPVISNANASQTVEVGDSVDVTMLVSDHTGVPPYLWSEPATEPSGDVALSTLGLTISPAGEITGSVTLGGTPTFPATYKTQIVVSDGLGGRTDTEDVTWTVYPQLTFAVANEASLANKADSATLAAGGGKSAYTYSDPGTTLPAGLTVSGSTVTGTPTTVGDTQSRLSVKDSLNRTATSNTFRWTVYGLTAPAGGVVVTEGQNVDQTVAYTCPVATGCTLTLSGTMPGLGLANAASTANNTATTLPVTGSGTAHITGQVQTTAVTGTATSANYGPSVTIAATGRASAQTATATWTAVVPPTISGSSVTTASGTYPSAGYAYTCPNAPCTVSLASSPGGIGLSTSVATGASNSTTSVTVPGTSGTVYLTGQVASGSAAGTASTPVVTIKDAGNVTGSDTDTWRSYTAPTAGFPGLLSFVHGGSVNRTLTVYCATSTCSATVSGLPSGVGIGTSSSSGTANSTTTVSPGLGTHTIYLSGKLSNATGSSVVSVTVTENSRSVSSVGVWTVT